MDKIVGIDVGTSKVCVVVAELDEDGELELISSSTVKSRGINAGTIVNIEDVADAVVEALDRAEEMGDGIKIKDSFINISGKHIKSFDSNATINIPKGKSYVISETEVKRVIDAARVNASTNNNQEIIHVLPKSFKVDDEPGIEYPVNMSGSRLEVDSLIVTGNPINMRNLKTVSEHANIYLDDIVINALASGEGVLTATEKGIGTLLLDIGSGTCDIGVFNDGKLVYTRVIRAGAKYITNDISIIFQIPFEEAEEIKIKHGTAVPEYIDDNAVLEVKDKGNSKKMISSKELSRVIEARAEEILGLVKKDLTRSGYLRYVKGGIVLTGGFAQLRGIDKLAKRVFGVDVRIGYPDYTGPLFDMVNSPIYATSVGLLHYGLKNSDNLQFSGGGIIQKIKDWLNRIFGDIF